MKKIMNNNKIILVLALFVVLAGILTETFVFNSSYFKIPKNQRGLHEIDVNKLVLNDLKIENNELYVIGKNPYFQMPMNNYDISIMLNLEKKNNNFQLYTKDKKGNMSIVYTSNSDVKKRLNIIINNNIKNLKFYIKTDEGKVGIQSIEMDNRFQFDIVRFLVMIGIGYMVLVLLYFRIKLQSRLHVAFFAISMILGSVLTICVPPNYSYDECAHFIRAYETASFDFNFSKTKTSNWISNIDELFISNGRYNLYNSYRDRLDNAKIFFNNDYSKNGHVASGEDTYLFVPYIPAAAGILVGKILRLPFIITYYLGRMFALLIFSILGALIIKHIKVAKRLVFITLLFPCAIMTAGSYSVDPMTLIFALASVAIFINMLCAEDNSISYIQVLEFAGCTAITSTCKITYAPLSLLILVVPRYKFKTISKQKFILLKVMSLFIVGIAAAGNFFYGETKNINQWKVPGVNVSAQVKYIISDLPRYAHVIYTSVTTSVDMYFQGAIGLLAYCGKINTIWVVIIVVTMIIVAAVDDESDVLKLRANEKIMLLLSSTMSWILALTALYITFTPVGKSTVDGVQGRYITPLIVPLLLLLKNGKIKINLNKEKLNYFLMLECSIVLIVSIIKVFFQYSN